MLKIVLVLTAFTSLSCLAAPVAPPFDYSGKRQLKLSDAAFRSFVHPQLKRINKDFFKIFSYFDAPYPTMLKGHKMFSAIIKSEPKMADDCPSRIKKCREHRTTLYKNLLRFEVFLTELQSGPDYKKFMKEKQALSSQWHEKTHQLQSELLRFSQGMKLHAPLPSPQKKNQKKTQELFRSLRRSYQSFFFSPLSENNKKIFTSVYHSFISPLSKYVTAKKSKKYFLSRIEEFNFSWNEFHMSMAKNDRVFPTKARSRAKQIHRRWVYILKTAMRN